MKRTLGLLLFAGLAFAAGFSLREQLRDPLPERSPEATGRPQAALTAPEWVMRYASALCSGNAAHVAAQHGPSLPSDPAVIQRYFDSRTYTCTSTRYLGEGKRNSYGMYVFMLRNGEGDYWWIITTESGKVVRLD